MIGKYSEQQHNFPGQFLGELARAVILLDS